MGIRVITLSGSGTVVDAQPHPRNPFVAVAKSGSDLLDLNYALPEHGSLASAVGFEPTTNRLTADRSTTELRWITRPKNCEWVFSRTIRSRQLPIRQLTCG